MKTKGKIKFICPIEIDIPFFKEPIEFKHQESLMKNGLPSELIIKIEKFPEIQKSNLKLQYCTDFNRQFFPLYFEEPFITDFYLSMEINEKWIGIDMMFERGISFLRDIFRIFKNGRFNIRHGFIENNDGNGLVPVARISWLLSVLSINSQMKGIKYKIKDEEELKSLKNFYTNFYDVTKNWNDDGTKNKKQSPKLFPIIRKFSLGLDDDYANQDRKPSYAELISMLEMLYLVDSHGELSAQLAIRVVKMLEEHKINLGKTNHELFKLMKDFYGIRSDYLHKGKTKKLDKLKTIQELDEHFFLLSNICRESIKFYIKFPEKFSKSYLEKLPL